MRVGSFAGSLFYKNKRHEKEKENGKNSKKRK